ncbi:phage holin family protein [Rummeliibacillus stabekisii]|uniref:phage holin family protein n=1 Tax=Rummeliibacillus stabekisii TaxID=241244 RepID=UPI00371528E5
MEQILKTVLSIVGGVTSYFLGGWSVLLTTLLLLNLFDYITGMAANWGQLSSKRGYQGIIKKGVMWVWIVVANLLYMVLAQEGFNLSEVIPDGVVILFILNEITSLGENSIKLGINVPEPIQKALAVMKGDK